jgi:hypothetical protein
MAFTNENHPYVLVTLFATCKLDGIFARTPLDYHVPHAISGLECMLLNIAFACILAPLTELVLRKFIKGEIFYSKPSVTREDFTLPVESGRLHRTPPDSAGLKFRTVLV